MGRRSPESARRPPHGGDRGGERRGAADGARGPALWRYPRRGPLLAHPGGDRGRPGGRSARDLLGRDAAAASDRPQPGDAAAPGADGRADRRPRRVGAGAPARPPARARGRPGSLRHHRDPRPGGGAAAGPPPAGDARRRGGRVRADRPGSRRPAASLLAAPRLLGAPPVSDPALEASGLEKHFTLHVQGGARLPVLTGASLRVAPGECVVLSDPSGAGKSTLLRVVYGNYLAQGGKVLVRHRGAMVDMAQASPRLVLDVRRHTMGYVSQFLRVIPRVPALDVVAQPL